MRLVHTSDWHAGRIWRGIRRLPELAAALDRLARYVIEHAIDLVLVTGDVFDTRAPSAAAEATVFRFFRAIGATGAHAVVIAGNHDSPERLEAWGQLAELVNVHTLGRPRGPDDGGVVELETQCGERAVVAALPFAAPGRLVSALALAADEADARRTYAEGMRALLAELARRFAPNAVNLVMAHTHLSGALFSGSERPVHLAQAWTASPADLPGAAQYVALGHLHRPQDVTAPAPTCYAGSALQLDFGEAGETKSFVRIDVHPGAAATVSRVPYEAGTPLVDLPPLSWSALEAQAPALAEAGWLRVTVAVDAADPELAARVRRLLPRAVAVRVALPEPTGAETVKDALARPAPEASALDWYRQFHEARHGTPPEAPVLDAFAALYERLRGA